MGLLSWFIFKLLSKQAGFMCILLGLLIGIQSYVYKTLSLQSVYGLFTLLFPTVSNSFMVLIALNVKYIIFENVINIKNKALYSPFAQSQKFFIQFYMLSSLKVVVDLAV